MAETIHPFLDGNGRIGRLLVGLFLTKESRLSLPLLYLSAYLELHRRDYYRHLQGVREEGDIDAYLRFFFTAVEEQAMDAIGRARDLVGLRERYYRQVERDRSRVSGVIPLIFGTPFLTARRVQTRLGLGQEGARRVVARALKYCG